MSDPDHHDDPQDVRLSSQPVAEHVAAADCEPNPMLWLWYLYFKPALFFEHFVIDTIPFLTALCAWSYGMAGVVDRIETKHMQGRLQVEQFGFDKGWVGYLLLVLLGGVFAGLLYYALGGWWYRKRLVWSGVADPDRLLVRRVYVYASQAWAVPVLLLTLLQSSFYGTPVEMLEGDGSWVDLIGFAIIPFLFWSVYISYRGAKQVFGLPNLGRGRLWFLYLPGAIYFVLVVFFIVLGVMMGMAELSQPPDLNKLKSFQSDVVSFQYPGNWDAEVDADQSTVQVEANQDAVLTLILYNSEAMPEEELALTVSDLRSSFTGWRDEYMSTRWGPLTGTGVTAVAEIEQQPYRITVLVAPLDGGRYLEVQAFCRLADEPDVRPGFDVIEKTFQLKSQ